MARRYALHLCTSRLSGEAREIQLLPAGRFDATDGRPGQGRTWNINAISAKALMALAATRKTPFVIDYEHQSLWAKQNGQPAPAAGWFDSLEWREGDGLYATGIEWTERARELIQNKEYLYVSPVFTSDAGGNVTRIHSVAITNVPALDGMQAIAAKFDEFEDDPMKDKLLKLLGLANDASDEDIFEAIQTVIDNAGARADEVESLKAEIEKAGVPDPAKFAPVDALTETRKELQALRAEVRDGEINSLVEAALDDGRLSRSMEEWARDLGQKDLTALRAFVEQAQPIAALTGTQSGGRNPADNAAALSDEDLIVCKQLGIPESEFTKLKAGETGQAEA